MRGHLVLFSDKAKFIKADQVFFELTIINIFEYIMKIIFLLNLQNRHYNQCVFKRIVFVYINYFL